MARIPEHEIERLKREVPIRGLVEGRGIELRPHGEKDLVGRCPWHEDRTPSLVVSPERNLWHCMGACGTGGSVIDWVMRAEGVGFREAVARLQSGNGSAPAGPAFDPETSPQALLAAAVDYYHQALAMHAAARDYLEERGLLDEALIARYRLGVADRTLGLALPARQLAAGSLVRDKLQQVGILRESGHEHFRGSLVIPVIRPNGEIAEVYGRKIHQRVRPGTPLHLYLPGSHRGVWNEPALAGCDEVILCEALIDALTLVRAGYPNVTASYGVNGFTEEHLEVFRRAGVRRVVIAYDRDEAGDTAAKKLSERLAAAGFASSRLRLPHGLDVNAYALKVQPARKALGVLLEGAAPMAGAPAARPAAPTPPVAAPAAAKERKAGPAPAPMPRPATPSLAADPVADPPHPPSTPTPEQMQPPPPPSLAADPALHTPAPAGPILEPVSATERELVYQLGDRRYRVRGLDRNASPAALKVTLLASAPNGGLAADTLDLYAAKPRAAFIAQAAAELGCEERTVKRDLGRLILSLETAQEARQQAQEPSSATVTLTPEERDEALSLLRDPSLLERIVADLSRTGVVGECTNKLVGYLAATSRQLERPLAVIIQSSSAAGKSSLMEAILALMPAEAQVKYSAMTGQSLFYMQETDLRHKILAIVEEEGAEKASYALKLLQSEGEIAIASTGKDPTTGRHVTHEYRVEGPVMILLTTTAIDIDEELLNRALVLTVSEERAQTRAIFAHQRARRTLPGLVARRERERIRALHQNAQRLLRPLAVVNPHAPQLTFSDVRTRMRRDHEKYLTLIDSIALLFQYQREVKTHRVRGERLRYIEVTAQDIALANRLAHEVLGRSLDELPPVTRRLLGLIHEMVNAACRRLDVERADYRFTRREVREHTRWGSTQLKCHLRRLEEEEYLIVHRGGERRRIVYELAYDGGGEGQAVLPGLIDPAALGSETIWSGGNGNGSGHGRAEVGPESGQSRPAASSANPSHNGGNGRSRRASPEITDPDPSEHPSHNHSGSILDADLADPSLAAALAAKQGGE